MIPLFHDFDGETVLIVGGGAVGFRKADRFAREAEVIVISPDFADGFSTLTQPDIHSKPAKSESESESDPEKGVVSESRSERESESESASESNPGGTTESEPAAGADSGTVRLIRAAPTPDTVSEWVARTTPALVVAATNDPAVNTAVEAAARGHGALINRTDRAGDREADSVVVPATVRDDPVAVAISTGGSSPALARYLREQVETELSGAGAMAELTGTLREELKTADVPPGERRDAVRAVVRDSTVWKGLQEGKANARQLADRVVRETRE